MTFEEAVEKLNDLELSPPELSRIRMFLAGEYTKIRSELDEISIRKPKVWMDLRSVSRTDREATMKWENSGDGQNQIKLTGRLKSIDKLQAAIKSRLETAAGEVRNLY